MLKKIMLLGLIVGIGAVSVPAFAAVPVVGAVGNVSASDGAALGTIGTRTWSLSDPNVNANTGGACLNTRCPSNYLTTVALQPGGYRSAAENTVLYNSDADNQTFYILYDGEIGTGTQNHALFYAVQGIVASNGTVNAVVGSPVTQGCTGTAPQNCMERADTRFSRPVPLTGTATNFGGGPGAFSVRSIGGMSPVPHVKTAIGGACPGGSVCLTWDEPETYAGDMKAGPVGGAPASPVKGVRLYRTAGPCSSFPSGSSAWVVAGDFPMGAGAAGVQDPLPPSGTCSWYSLNVRLTGPGGGVSEVETGKVGTVGPVGMNSVAVAQAGTAIHIVRVGARYAGRNTVVVNWTTGISGDVSSYYVSRASSPAGPYTRISDSIASVGDNHTYTFSDKVRSNGHDLFYQIEVVKTDGTSEVSAPTSVTLPRAKGQNLAGR